MNRMDGLQSTIQILAWLLPARILRGFGAAWLVFLARNSGGAFAVQRFCPGCISRTIPRDAFGPFALRPNERPLCYCLSVNSRGEDYALPRAGRFRSEG